jgi:hypothetical protein
VPEGRCRVLEYAGLAERIADAVAPHVPATGVGR